MNDIWSMALLWSPYYLLVSLVHDGWMRWAVVLVMVSLVAGAALGVIRREPKALVLLPALVLTHVAYLVTALIRVQINWLGEPLMYVLDGVCIFGQLGLGIAAIVTSKRSKLATTGVSIFNLAYALPYLIFNILNTYYVGL